MNKKTKIIIIVAVSVVLFSLFAFAAGTGTVSLPKTGQTTCYDVSGNVIPCPGTGQDGDIQAGTNWPSPRFTDNGNGTITDNLTGLMWQRVPLSTLRSWEQAIDYCSALELAGYTDWRLPNRKELMSLVNYGQADNTAWLNSQGFSNVQAGSYWSAGTYSNDTNRAWSIPIGDGYLSIGNKTSYFYYVVAVRSGQ